MNIFRKLKLYYYEWQPQIRVKYYKMRYGMDIADHVYMGDNVNLDKKMNPKGIHIGEHTFLAFGVVVLAHDGFRKLKTDTYIGHHCGIGIHSIIMPGVRIGNHVTIGAGSVVTKDIPDNCIAAGNPARIIRQNVKIGDNGVIIE